MRTNTFISFISVIVLALLLTLVSSLSLFALDAENLKVQAQTEKQEGISYATWWSGQYSQPDADLALASLADTGANWIGLIVTQYQDNISSTTIYSTTATPTDADLIHVITQANSLGLKVMLKPHVDLVNDPNHWRGQIGQDFTNSQWNTWFASYQNFINHYAQLAETYNADQFAVGTELSASQGRETNWRTVITDVRSYYNGPLVYAANHGDEVSNIWWDAVDYIGVDAYYPLTSKNNPTVAELKTAWQPYVATLANLASTWNKSIIFTEIGYRSQDGANQHPWDWQVGGTVDLQEQADTYQAALESVFNQSWFAGMYWWNWDTDPFQGGPCDDGYTPYDKPAEDILRSWYGASPRPNLQPDYSQSLDIYTDNLGSGWADWSWDATINLNSTTPVYSGTQSISATIQGWGALSLHYANFDTSPYYWLEFYIRKSSSEQQLRVFANDENDAELRYLRIDDCRYTGGQAIQPGIWTQVRVPLADLEAVERQIQRVSIKNYAAEPFSFAVDEMKFVVAVQRVYLPIIIRNNQ